MGVEWARRVAMPMTSALFFLQGMTAEEKQRMSLGPKDLSVIQRRAVERLYGEQGSTVLELLNRNPSVTLPILQGRLQQKHEEFVRVKREMEPHWQKQYEANYINSLDHRSFYFKQSDRKHLSHKGIVADMKELADKRTSTEAFLSSVPPGLLPVPSSPQTIWPQHAGLRSSPVLAGAISYLRTAALPPDMELGYDERQTHEECYRLIVCAAGEFLGPAARIRAMDLWHSILEPLLGCPQHAEENEDVGNKEVGNTTPPSFA